MKKSHTKTHFRLTDLTTSRNKQIAHRHHLFRLKCVDSLDVNSFCCDFQFLMSFFVPKTNSSNANSAKWSKDSYLLGLKWNEYFNFLMGNHDNAARLQIIHRKKHLNCTWQCGSSSSKQTYSILYRVHLRMISCKFIQISVLKLGSKCLGNSLKEIKMNAETCSKLFRFLALYFPLVIILFISLTLNENFTHDGNEKVQQSASENLKFDKSYKLTSHVNAFLHMLYLSFAEINIFTEPPSRHWGCHIC